jgi:hypothetical protein
MLLIKPEKMLATSSNSSGAVTPLSVVSEGTMDESHKQREKTVVELSLVSEGTIQ